MTGFDIAVLLLVGLGAVTGFMRGFIEELMALASWVFAMFAIHFLHTPLTSYFVPKIGTESGASVLSFALLLMVPYASVKLVGNWAGSAARSSVLGPIDRVLGFGFGGIKGIIITIMAFSVVSLGYDTLWGPGGRPGWITQARTYPLVDRGSEQLVAIIAARRSAAREAEAHKLGKH